MKKSDFDAILKRYLAGKASNDEEKLVDEWFDNLPASDKFNLGSDDLTSLQQVLWNRIEHHTKFSKPSQRIHWSRVAASLLIVITCGMAFNVSELIHERSVVVTQKNDFSELNTIANTNNTDYSVCLHDGSTVVLRPGSIIHYPNVFGDERHIVLQGDAFFDVARDPSHPFVVQTGSVTTRVLGTSFWVEENSKANTVEVSVKSGKVMVYATEMGKNESAPLILKPNQKGIYNQRTETLIKKLVDEPIVLDESVLLKLKYENTPVTEILDTLEKIYGIQISYNAQDLATCTLTTELVEENLFERIQIVCNALGLEYRAGNEAVEISGKCK